MDGLHATLNYYLVNIIPHNSLLTRVLGHCGKPKSYYQVKACYNNFQLQLGFILHSHIHTHVSANYEQMETYLMRQQTFDLTCIRSEDLPCKGNIFLGNPEPRKRGGRI